MNKHEFYLLQCNAKQHRYLGFTHSKNKTNPTTHIYTAQTNSNDFDSSIYFDNLEDAELAKTAYIESGKIQPQYISSVEPIKHYLSDEEVNNLKYIITDLDLGAYILLNNYKNYCRS